MAVGELLNRARQHLAFDSRDKLYGMLGLQRGPGHDDRSVGLLKPDYGSPICRVLRDAVRYTFLEDRAGELRALELVSHRDEQDACIDGWPTWVPRYDRRKEYLVRAVLHRYALSHTDTQRLAPSIAAR